MGIIKKLFGKRSDISTSDSIQVGLIFSCDLVPNYKEVLNSAVPKILAKNPGVLVREPDITVAPKARAIRITLTIRVRNQNEAYAFKSAGEAILRQYGLQS